MLGGGFELAAPERSVADREICKDQMGIVFAFGSGCEKLLCHFSRLSILCAHQMGNPQTRESFKEKGSICCLLTKFERTCVVCAGVGRPLALDGHQTGPYQDAESDFPKSLAMFLG